MQKKGLRISYLSPHHCWQQQSQWAGRKDDPDAKGLHLVQLDKGARLLLDEPFGLGSAAIIYFSELDDGPCTISYSYRLSANATKSGHPKTALVAQSAHSR